MKKGLTLLLALMVAISMVVPTPIFAEDQGTVEAASIVLDNGSTGKYIYSSDDSIKASKVTGVEYVKEDNVLVLTGYSNKTEKLVIKNMGSSFSIKVAGKNYLQGIILMGSKAQNKAAYLEITGLGDIYLNENRLSDHAIEVICDNTKGTLKMDPKTNVYAYSKAQTKEAMVITGASESPTFALPYEKNVDVASDRDHKTITAVGKLLASVTLKNLTPLDAEMYPNSYAADGEVVYQLEENYAKKLDASLEDFEEAEGTVKTNLLTDESVEVGVYTKDSETHYANAWYLIRDDVFKGAVYDIYEGYQIEGSLAFKLIKAQAKELPEGWVASTNNKYTYSAVYKRDAYVNLNCAHGYVQTVKKAKAATYFAAGNTAFKICLDCGDVRSAERTIAKKTFTLSSVKAQKKGFTATWKKATSATGYKVRYSTSSTFKTYKTKTVKAKYLKTTVSKLKAKKTYYVKVRAYKQSGKKTLYSKWSKVLKVKTK